ncbi:MAG TPA: hypothetical protein VIN07_03045 [Flavipsychrobacter sp.]
MKKKLIPIIAIGILTSCKPGVTNDLPTSAETNWAVDLKYINPDTKQMIVGKDRYIQPNYARIYIKQDSIYKEYYAYNPTALHPDTNTDSMLLSIGKSIYTSVTKKNEHTDISGNVAKEYRFNEEFVVVLRNGRDTISDTFALVKDTDHEFRVYLNGEWMLTAPSPTRPRQQLQLTIER